MVYFYQILHTYACQNRLTTDMQNILCVNETLLSISPADGGKLVKMLITLEPHGIFGSNFAYTWIISFRQRKQIWL